MSNIDRQLSKKKSFHYSITYRIIYLNFKMQFIIFLPQSCWLIAMAMATLNEVVLGHFLAPMNW